MIHSRKIAANVRRYGSVALCRGGMRFCRQAAVQECAFRYKVIALAKTMTPGGRPRLQPGQPVPPATERSSLVRNFSRHRRQ